MTDDLEDRLRTVTGPADAVPPRLQGDVHYAIEDTSVGRMLFAVRGNGAVLASMFTPVEADVEGALDRIARSVSPRVVRGGTGPDAVRREVDDYLAGRRRGFDLRIDPVLATTFQQGVLVELARTGYGERTTYGALATRLGRPTASRAVGAALGANPLCVLLPCHRVLAGSGALTGYAGGLEAKRRLLELEGPGAP